MAQVHVPDTLHPLCLDNYLGRYSLNIFPLFFALKYVSSRCIIIVPDVTTEQVSVSTSVTVTTYCGRTVAASAHAQLTLHLLAALCSVEMLRLGLGLIYLQTRFHRLLNSV